jgi:hypothetical protein
MFGFLNLMLQYQLMIALKIEESSFDTHLHSKELKISRFNALMIQHNTDYC